MYNIFNILSYIIYFNYILIILIVCTLYSVYNIFLKTGFNLLSHVARSMFGTWYLYPYCINNIRSGAAGGRRSGYYLFIFFKY